MAAISIVDFVDSYFISDMKVWMPLEIYLNYKDHTKMRKNILSKYIFLPLLQLIWLFALSLHVEEVKPVQWYFNWFVPKTQGILHNWPNVLGLSFLIFLNLYLKF